MYLQACEEEEKAQGMMYGEEDPAAYDDLYYYNEDMQGLADEIQDGNSFDSTDEDLFTTENLK